MRHNSVKNLAKYFDIHNFCNVSFKVFKVFVNYGVEIETANQNIIECLEVDMFLLHIL